MGLTTIAILSPEDMGHGVGKVLVEHGYQIIACLAGRSQRTRDLAAIAGFGDVPSLEEMTSQKPSRRYVGANPCDTAK